MEMVGQDIESMAESVKRLVDVLALNSFAELVANDSAQHNDVTELRQDFNELTALLLDLKKMMGSLLVYWKSNKQFEVNSGTV